MAAEDPSTRIVRSLPSEQLMLPDDFRRRLDIRDDTPLQISLEDGELRIRKLTVTQTAGEMDWFKDLYDLFAPVREEIVERGISEDEVNADIDAAIRAVRERHD